MELPLPYARRAGDSLVVDQQHLAAFSSDEAHAVVLILPIEHHKVKLELLRDA
jgi:hypothetical protein